jgi:hypothetical protein
MLAKSFLAFILNCSIVLKPSMNKIIVSNSYSRETIYSRLYYKCPKTVEKRFRRIDALACIGMHCIKSKLISVQGVYRGYKQSLHRHSVEGCKFNLVCPMKERDHK